MPDFVLVSGRPRQKVPRHRSTADMVGLYRMRYPRHAERFIHNVAGAVR